MAAIQSGIMSAEISHLPASCPTGDCQWPIVQTLAVCGECQDFTAEWSLDINKTDFNPNDLEQYNDNLFIKSKLRTLRRSSRQKVRHIIRILSKSSGLD